MNQNFQSKIFWVTVPENFVGESFTVAIISRIEKVRIRGGGEVTRFSIDFFCPTVPKKIVGEPFCAVFQENSSSDKVYG